MAKQQFRSFEPANVLLGKIGIAEVWWVRWSDSSNMGMLRTKAQEMDVMFLCGDDAEVIVPEMEEDDMPFKMTLEGARAIFNVLEKTGATFLNKQMWSEYVAFGEGKAKVASSTFSGDVGELLLDEIKALRVEMQKEKEGE